MDSLISNVKQLLCFSTLPSGYSSEILKNLKRLFDEKTRE